MDRKLVFKPTQGGGRLLEVVTDHGTYRKEWDSGGTVLSEEPLVMLEPLPPAAPQRVGVVDDHVADPLKHLNAAARKRVATRREICAGCAKNGGLTALTVRCEGCGCAGLSLAHGTCKLGKWPIAAAE